jgi:hypothetical protein
MLYVWERHACKIVCGNRSEETRWETNVCIKIIGKMNSENRMWSCELGWSCLWWGPVIWILLLLWSMMMWILMTIWRPCPVSLLWDRYLFEHFVFPVPVFIPPVFHSCHSTKRYSLAKFLQFCWLSESYSQLL